MKKIILTIALALSLSTLISCSTDEMVSETTTTTDTIQDTPNDEQPNTTRRYSVYLYSTCNAFKYVYVNGVLRDFSMQLSIYPSTMITLHSGDRVVLVVKTNGCSSNLNTNRIELTLWVGPQNNTPIPILTKYCDNCHYLSTNVYIVP